MTDNMMPFELIQLRNIVVNFKEDLQTNYLIVKRGERDESDDSENQVELEMDQYDLFHMETQEHYLDVSIFPDLGLLNVNFINSGENYALELETNIPITKFENLSIEEISQMILYTHSVEIDSNEK